MTLDTYACTVAKVLQASVSALVVTIAIRQLRIKPVIYSVDCMYLWQGAYRSESSPPPTMMRSSRAPRKRTCLDPLVIPYREQGYYSQRKTVFMYIQVVWLDGSYPHRHCFHTHTGWSRRTQQQCGWWGELWKWKQTTLTRSWSPQEHRPMSASSEVRPVW